MRAMQLYSALFEFVHIFISIHFFPRLNTESKLTPIEVVDSDYQVI